MKTFWHAGLQGSPVVQYEEEHHLLLTLYEILTIHKNRLVVYFRVASPNFLYTAIAKTSETLEATPFFQIVTLKIDKPISKSLVSVQGLQQQGAFTSASSITREEIWWSSDFPKPEKPKCFIFKTFANIQTLSQEIMFQNIFAIAAAM